VLTLHCDWTILAHRVISVPRSYWVAFGVKRTSTREGHRTGFMSTRPSPLLRPNDRCSFRLHLGRERLGDLSATERSRSDAIEGMHEPEVLHVGGRCRSLGSTGTAGSRHRGPHRMLSSFLHKSRENSTSSRVRLERTVALKRRKLFYSEQRQHSARAAQLKLV
jgi:hypothetical protein